MSKIQEGQMTDVLPHHCTYRFLANATWGLDCLCSILVFICMIICHVTGVRVLLRQ